MHTYILHAANVTKTFRTKRGEVHALKGVSMSLEEGSLTAMVGPDGAGKTTFIRMVTGLLAPDTGSIIVDGIHVAKEPQRVQDILSYMPQKFGLYENLTVEENINFYADLHNVSKEEREKRFPRLLTMAGLESFTGRLAGKLSGGMKQKLALITALVRKPRLLLLDEPSVGVDPLSRRELWEILHELKESEKLTILVSTAYRDECEQGDMVHVFIEGEIIASDTPNGIREVLDRRVFGTAQEKAVIRGVSCGSLRSTDSVISVRHLVKRFNDFTAVANTSFDVRAGEIFGLLGANGAGKTTTFRMLCGLLEATEGELYVKGIDMRKKRREGRKYLGYVSQKFSLYDGLSVQENLVFFGGAYGLFGEALAQRIEEVAEEFDLKERMEEAAGDIPMGFRQRLAMSAALLHNPEILFLDEPTSGIDPLERIAFWKEIKRLQENGKTVIVTTHFMDEAEYCDRILIQDHGRVLALGSPREVRGQYDLLDENMNDVFIEIIERERRGE
ncbi:ATP-binding cassette domain-containing protein [Selenomonas sp. TAMA-11512]|uniref:ATP-binding cassette domain-containing protein n=1 Tax=Selenomonas sp. TAMA-11512 TaxID=3095337 RepID=UPI00308791D0|nr:ATP-binding cassette domain-containing protein [Selenomonas sp. TAMA-11512]